jgi:hypothetical protein
MSSARALRHLLLVALTPLLVAACGDDKGDASTSTDRQAVVADRGSAVMPFDLEATTHTFTPTDDGLIEDVTADDPDDAENIALIREHLTDERERFQRGDFGDPARIHGDEMPGLGALEAGAADIEVTYEDLDDGARLTFTSEDPELIEALHRWGEAQVTDHGEHAAAG